jgi:hypothetical protein
MRTKDSLWQSRWQIDQAQAIATHDSGLRVRLQDGRGLAENPDEIALSLTAGHGAHNATAMVSRLVREGAQLLIDPFARGWRN